MNEKEAWYSGDVVNCVRHGKGVYNYPFGGKKLFSYDGDWINGTKQQHGAFQIKGYSSYKGNFKDGEMTGKGTRKWEDGRMYEGEWLNGEMHGKGNFINNRTNEIYEGYFADNKRNGPGNLQRGLESYKGTFKDHKFHGSGTYLYANKFILEGSFVENILQGKVVVKWDKLASMECEFVDGVPNGNGFFSCKDRSFDFEGSWEHGLPVINQSSESLYVAVDRTAIEQENAAKAALKGKEKKKPAAPAKKGKNDAPTIEPTITVQQGESLAAIEIRTVRGKLPEDEANLEPVVVDAKKPKNAPIVPSVPVPDLFNIPNERARRVTVRLRPILENTDEVAAIPANAKSAVPVEPEVKKPLQLGEPVTFWLKSQSQEQVGSDKTRFSPKSTVIMCDTLKSGQNWNNAYNVLSGGHAKTFTFYQQPSTAAPVSAAENTSETTVLPTKVKMDNAIVHDPANDASVASYALSSGVTASVTLDTSTILDSEQWLSFVVDFSLDSVALMKQHIASCAPTGYYVESLNSTSLTPVSTLKKKTSTSLLSQTATKPKKVAKSFRSKDLEVLVSTFTKTSPEFPASDFKRLDLVLLIPSKNIDDYYIQVRDAKLAQLQYELALTEATENNLDPPAPPEIKPQGVVSWSGCSWELRCTEVKTTVTVVETVVEREPAELGINLEGDAASIVSTTAGGTADKIVDDKADGETLDGENILSADPAAEQEPLPPQVITTSTSKTETVLSVCERWAAGEDFLPDSFHSLALSLCAQQVVAPDDTASALSSPRGVSFSANSGDSQQQQQVRSNNQVEDALRNSADNEVSAPVPVTSELVVDGQGRMKLPKDITSPETTSNNSSSVGTLSGWMPDYPFFQDLSAPSVDTVHTATTAADDNASKASTKKGGKADKKAEPVVVVERVAVVDHNKKVTVEVGSEIFIGQLKGLAVCARSDRVDSVRATSCYDAWRNTQNSSHSSTVLTSASDNTAEGNSSNGSVTIPHNYSQVSEFTADLFCGSAEIPFDRMRIPPAIQSADGTASSSSSVSEGLYVLEISDGVNAECSVALPVEEVLYPKLPCDVQHMTKVARVLPPNMEIIVKIEPAEL